MNLRKLLCGLLALCLLLTMAPAALMEESAPEEQVVELGGEEVASDAVEAEEWQQDADVSQADLVLPTDFKGSMSGNEYLVVGDTMTIEPDDTKGYFIKSWNNTNARIASVTPDDPKYPTSLDVEAIREGKGRVNVTLGRTGSSKTWKYAVTIEVYDGTKAAKITILRNGKEVKALDMEMSTAAVVNVYTELEPAGIGGDIYWSSSNTKVADVAPRASLEGEVVQIAAKGKGTATITAKVGNVKATVKVKVSDKYAPKSIKVKSQTGKNEIGFEGILQLYTVISPAPYGDAPVKFTVDNAKYASFLTATGDVAKSVISYDGTAVLVAGHEEGTVKVTAETYNGKKNSIKITVKNPFKPDGVGIWGFYKNEQYEVERWDETLTELNGRQSDPIPTRFLLVPELSINGVTIGYNEMNDPDRDYIDDATEFEYANVKWESSNKKVATIEKFKDYYGYAQSHVYDTDFLLMAGGNYYDVDPADDPIIDYAALVTIKGTGTTKITAKTRDGKKKFTVTLKVVDSHEVTRIDVYNSTTVAQPLDYPISAEEFYDIYPFDAYGKVTVSLTHNSSKVTVADGDIIAHKAGTYTFKVKASNGKSKTFKVKFA